MKLILFRHGTALDRDVAVQQKMEDSARPLIEKGRMRTERMAKALARWEENVDLLVTSPFLRAQQTAQILLHRLKPLRYQESAELVPSAPPHAFANWLEAHSANATCILAVGHEPHLSLFSSWVLTGESQSLFEMRKSGMLCLEFESFEDIRVRTAELKWLVQPKLISE